MNKKPLNILENGVKTDFTGDLYFSGIQYIIPMNTNEKCLIKFLSLGNKENSTETLIRFLLNHNIDFKFKDLNPVSNIIDEMEFSENIMYN